MVLTDLYNACHSDFLLLVPPRQEPYAVGDAIINQRDIRPICQLSLNLVPEYVSKARQVVDYLGDLVLGKSLLIAYFLALIHFVSIAARVLPVYKEASWVH